MPNSFQFTGQRKSELAGVHFFQARYYDSLAGVFLQPDSLVPDPYNPLDWNRYLYVRASPINFNDPSGHAVSCADGDEGGGCGSSSPMVLLNLSTIDTQDAIRKYLRDHPHYHPEFDPAVQNDNSAYFLIATAMMQVSQEGNYSTLMIGMTGMGGNNIVGRSDIFYAIDSQGNRAWMYSSGGGASFPPAPFVSIGASVTITNAPSIDKLVGLGSSTGGIIGVLGVIGITVEIDKFQDSNNNKIYTGFSVSAGSTLSPSPFAGHIYTTATLTKYITWRSK